MFTKLQDPLSYALTVTVDIPAVYLQQFWNTVRKVPNANETIHFMLDRQEITYTMDMFCLTLNMLVETLNKPFIAPCLLHEESCSTVVSVYTTGNVTVRGMLILNESITDDIRAIEKYKEYEKVFVQVNILMIQPQPVKSAQGTNRTPSAHMIRTPTTIAQKKRKNVAGETSLLIVQIWARSGFKGIEEFLL
ncbi:hypothetical protein Tco_1341398 [Tanacetum coccineum]